MICKNLSQNWEYLLFDILLPVEVKYLPKGDFEVQIKFSGDILIFHMHSNIFDFPSSHHIHSTSYVEEDKMRSFCGLINIYNFLSV